MSIVNFYDDALNNKKVTKEEVELFDQPAWFRLDSTHHT